VSNDAMEMFGVLDLEAGFEGCRFAIGIRNANNKRFRLACTVGLRVFVCHNPAFRGDYTPVLAKHSKHFSLEDALSMLIRCNETLTRCDNRSNVGECSSFRR
jgi:hypothetical protein